MKSMELLDNKNPKAIAKKQPDLNATLTSIAEKEVTYGNY